MNPSHIKYSTNLQASIQLAQKSYSNNANKILISLYDNVPDIAIGVCATVSYGGLFSEYRTIEEAVKAKHKKIASYTKEEILSLRNSNIQFILLRPDDTSYDEVWYNQSTGNKLLDFDGSPYVKELYGTIDNPTYGKMYSFTDSTIDTIITENIYQDVMEILQSDIHNVKIVDYFPPEIVKHFSFKAIENPSIGTVSENINEETNSIEWTIGTLNGDTFTTLKYQLKIKDMQNIELLNKIISTNEKVILTYTDSNLKDYSATLDDSPKIQLLEVKEEKNNNTNNNDKTNNTDKTDNTVSNKILPFTGIINFIIVCSIILLLIGLFALIKFISYKDVK